MTLDSIYPQGGFDAAEMWLSALRAAGRSPATLANYRHAVDKLAEWRDDGDVTTLTKFEALRFVQHLTDQYAPGGVANRVRSLRACFSWLLAEEIVESNPFARVKIRVPEEAKTTADDEQIERMLAHAKGNRAICAADAAGRHRRSQARDRRRHRRRPRPQQRHGAVPDSQDRHPHGAADRSGRGRPRALAP